MAAQHDDYKICFTRKRVCCNYFIVFYFFFLFLFFLKGRHSGKSVYLTARYRISFTGPLNIGSWRLLSGFKADQLTAAPKRADHL